MRVYQITSPDVLCSTQVLRVYLCCAGVVISCATSSNYPTYANHDHFDSLVFVDKHTQPSNDPCFNSLLHKYYGSIDPMNTLQYITSQFQTGDMHIAIYDFENSMMYAHQSAFDCFIRVVLGLSVCACRGASLVCVVAGRVLVVVRYVSNSAPYVANASYTKAYDNQFIALNMTSLFSQPHSDVAVALHDDDDYVSATQ